MVRPLSLPPTRGCCTFCASTGVFHHFFTIYLRAGVLSIIAIISPHISAKISGIHHLFSSDRIGYGWGAFTGEWFLAILHIYPGERERAIQLFGAGLAVGVGGRGGGKREGRKKGVCFCSKDTKSTVKSVSQSRMSAPS